MLIERINTFVRTPFGSALSTRNDRPRHAMRRNFQWLFWNGPRTGPTSAGGLARVPLRFPRTRARVGERVQPPQAKAGLDSHDLRFVEDLWLQEPRKRETVVNIHEEKRFGRYGAKLLAFAPEGGANPFEVCVATRVRKHRRDDSADHAAPEASGVDVHNDGVGVGRHIDAIDCKRNRRGVGSEMSKVVFAHKQRSGFPKGIDRNVVEQVVPVPAFDSVTGVEAFRHLRIRQAHTSRARSLNAPRAASGRRTESKAITFPTALTPRSVRLALRK